MDVSARARLEVDVACITSFRRATLVKRNVVLLLTLAAFSLF